MVRRMREPEWKFRNIAADGALEAARYGYPSPLPMMRETTVGQNIELRGVQSWGGTW